MLLLTILGGMAANQHFHLHVMLLLVDALLS